MQPVDEWRLTTPQGIPFKLLKRSGDFVYEGGSAVEEYLIESSSLLDFVGEAFPAIYVLNGVPYYSQQPTLGGLGTLVPMRVRWEEFTPGKPIDPFGSDPYAPTGTYDQFCKVVVDFGPSPTNNAEPNPDDERTWLEVSANASGVFLASDLPSNAEWLIPGMDGLGERVQEQNVPFTITEVQTEWTINWPSLPADFFSNTVMTRIRSMLGKVNSTQMRAFHEAPAETILFLGFSAPQSHTWRKDKPGLSPINLTANFLEKNFVDTNGTSVTHNHFYRPGKGYQRLTVNSKPVHATTDLNKLFRP